MLNYFDLPTSAPSPTDLEQILGPSFQESLYEQINEGLSGGKAVPYLESHRTNSTKWELFNNFINSQCLKTLYCGKEWMGGKGCKTGNKYYRRLTCKKWYCEDCGADNGRIHKKRLGRANEIWGEITEKSACRQLVITVPEEDRVLLRVNTAPAILQKIAHRTGKKFFPGEPSVQAFQGFGDKDKAKYHPHVHILFKPGYGSTLKLSPERLAEIRAYAGKQLRKHGCKHEGEFDIKYNYGRGVTQVKHKLRYLNRCCPGPDNRKSLKDDPELLYFFMNTLRRFKYIRFYGWPKKVVEDLESDKDDLVGFEKLAGEKIIWDHFDIVSNSELMMIWSPFIDDELSIDLRRLRGP